MSGLCKGVIPKQNPVDMDATSSVSCGRIGLDFKSSCLSLIGWEMGGPFIAWLQEGPGPAFLLSLILVLEGLGVVAGSAPD